MAKRAARIFQVQETVSVRLTVAKGHGFRGSVSSTWDETVEDGAGAVGGARL